MTYYANLIVLMGPAGCGKSTIGEALAKRTGWPFIEGDDYHPDENVEKQRRGVALTDADRRTWIDNILSDIHKQPPNSPVLVACSALTSYVQNRLLKESPRRLRFVYLHIVPGVLHQRLAARTTHFMPVDLMDSQLAALQIPGDAIHIEAERPVSDICTEILERLDAEAPPEV